MRSDIDFAFCRKWLEVYVKLETLIQIKLQSHLSQSFKRRALLVFSRPRSVFFLKTNEVTVDVFLRIEVISSEDADELFDMNLVRFLSTWLLQLQSDAPVTFARDSALLDSYLFIHRFWRNRNWIFRLEKQPLIHVSYHRMVAFCKGEILFAHSRELFNLLA